MEKTYIISDLHLGSEACEAKELNLFLEKIRTNCTRLILNGDIFDSMDFRRLKKKHWHVLSMLRKMSDEIEIEWIVGNHDTQAEIISHLLGVTAVEEYEFKTGGRKVLVLHGHVFDDFIDDHPFLTWLGDSIYGFLQWIDKTHYFARQAKHSSKHYLRCAEIIKEGAIKLATKKGFDVVCCGHTHNATSDTSGKVHYYNSGCWTERPSTYIEIVDGEFQIKQFVREEVLCP